MSIREPDPFESALASMIRHWQFTSILSVDAAIEDIIINRNHEQGLQQLEETLRSLKLGTGKQ